MRLPFTNHRKTQNPISVVLNSYDISSGKLTPMEDIDPNNITYLRLSNLENYLDHIKEQKKYEVADRTQKQFFSSEAYNTANSIPFPVLFDKLKKFPKLYKGKKYIF
jgi:hypothetical protein